MKCEVCGKPALKNKVICSELCQKIRLRIYKLGDKYAPTHGCDNCWGDLHQGCTEQCKKEFKKLGEISEDLWSLVYLTNQNTRRNK